METQYKNLNSVLEGLISRYKERVPDVDKIVNGLLKEGILNQHTLQLIRLTIQIYLKNTEVLE